MAENIVEKVRDVMEEVWSASPEAEFFREHSLAVAGYAKQLARKVGADEEIVELAGLLHDITGVRGDKETHHITGAAEAERILRGLGYPEERVAAVKHCVHAHRGRKEFAAKRESKEAECIASADAMSHIHGIGHMLYIAYSIKRLKAEEGKKWVMEKLERSWNKMMPEAREIMKPKYEAAKLIFGSNE